MDLGKVASELVQLMSDTVRLRSASATAYISSSTSPSRPLGGGGDYRPSYYSPSRSVVKVDDQSSDGSPLTLTASLWKRRLDHAKKEQEEMAILAGFSKAEHTELAFGLMGLLVCQR